MVDLMYVASNTSSDVQTCWDLITTCRRVTSQHSNMHNRTSPLIMQTCRSTTLVLNPFELLHPCCPLVPQRHKQPNRFHLHIRGIIAFARSEWQDTSPWQALSNMRFLQSSCFSIDTCGKQGLTSFCITLFGAPEHITNTKSWVFRLWGSFDCLNEACLEHNKVWLATIFHLL